MKIIQSSLVALIMLLAVIMWFDVEKELMVIAKENDVLMVKSDELETFSYDLLTNLSESYYFNSDFISSISLKNSENEIVLNLERVREIDEIVEVNNQKYYPIRLYFKVGISFSEIDLYIDEAQLYIFYDNGEKLVLPFGDFVYIVNTPFQKDLAINALNATYGTINNEKTVTSVSMEISNQTGKSVEITNIYLPTEKVKLNLFLAKRDYFCVEDVKQCLDIPNYDFRNEPVDKVISWLILPNQNIQFVLPFAYIDITTMYRFPVIIEYQVNEEKRFWVMDDFPFMQTIPFDENWIKGAIFISHDKN